MNQGYMCCRGSMQTAVCKRPARYVTEYNAGYHLRVVPNHQAMFCKQHAQIFLARMASILAEARAEAETQTPTPTPPGADESRTPR